MKVVFFSRGLGIGHAARDLALASALKSESVESTFFSYESGLKYFHNMQVPVTDTRFSNTSHAVMDTETLIHSFFEDLIEYSLILTKEEGLVIGDEELFLPFTCKILKRPSIFITDWFPNMIQKYKSDALIPMAYKAFDQADYILVPDFEDQIVIPEQLEEKTFFFGPFFRGSIPKLRESRMYLRKKYGFDNTFVVVVTVGGSQLNFPVLEKCVEAYRILSETEDTRMILITGPDISPGDLPDTEAEIRQFVPDFMELAVSADLVITGAGHSTLMELSALGVPCMVIPIAGWVSQEREAARVEKADAGIVLPRQVITPEVLASTIRDLLNDSKKLKKLSENGIKRIPFTDGAFRAAQFILDSEVTE
jgi:UDP-N-acetylglucosamine--N-acetylmuramyl-(pentapeptide) pyrophosphoryl-undecaprenol N-acetylglucosamine transferase